MRRPVAPMAPAKRAGGSFAAALACILAGGAAFSLTQHVSLLTGIYWAFVTSSTVGFGDVTPHNDAGKVIAIAVIVTCIPLLADAYQHLHLHRLRRPVRAALTEHEDMKQNVTSSTGGDSAKQ